MQNSTFCRTTAECHLSRSCFYRGPKCEWKLMPIFKRPAPFHTQEMGHQWVISWLWLIIADRSLCGGKASSQREGWQARTRQVSYCTNVALRTPQGAFLLILHDWECILHQAKACLTQFRAWHGSGCDCILGVSLTQIPSQRLPQSLQSVTTAIPNQNQVSVCLPACWTGKPALSPQRAWWGALITHVSKGLESCNPLKTIPFGNLS